MSESATALLSSKDLTITVDDRILVERLGIEMRPGDLLAILGPNGVGKSLTLHTLAGLREIESGEVALGKSSLNTLSRQKISISLALLPQYTEDVFPATVFDTVMIGRHPHIPKFQWESERDKEIGRDTLLQMGLGNMLDRNIATLSGGERRRLAIAQVLTQSPSIYLLDEPTNHLDPQHQLDVLQIFLEKARGGASVAISMHDVNLAARFCNKCLLLFGDGRWEYGETNQVLTESRLTELYLTTMEAFDWRGVELYVAAGHA